VVNAALRKSSDFQCPQHEIYISFILKHQPATARTTAVTTLYLLNITC